MGVANTTRQPAGLVRAGRCVFRLGESACEQVLRVTWGETPRPTDTISPSKIHLE